MPSSAVLLFEDETILRLFPVLRRSWALKGHQAQVSITGRNDQRVLFCALNVRTGHRIVMDAKGMRQGNFQAFLRLLRKRYRRRPVWILLDRAGLHTATGSKKLAAKLNIELIWLPKQCSELNAVDHLWREVKAAVSANYQYKTIELHAQTAISFVMGLNPKQALTKAGILAQNFWLHRYL